MKRKIVLLFAFVLALQYWANAQCTPDPQYTQPGVYPEELAPVCTNSPYSQVFTVVVPVDTFVTSPFPMTIPIDSISLEALLGLPPGFSYVCSQPTCAFPGGTSGCIILTGTTPATPGSYIIRSVTNAYVQALGSPIIQTDTSLMDTLVIIGGPSTTVNTTPAACGQSTGSATCAANDPYPPYTYSWSTGATGSNTISGLAAGNYTVFVTNGLGCITEQLFSVSNANGATVAINATATSCNGGSDGSLTAQASGSTGPYIYSWSNGGTTATISNLNAGTYSVTVTDAQGCITVQSSTVSEPAILTTSITTTNPTCAGGTGSLAASPSGGTAPFTYSWSNGMTNQNITVSAGNYTVTVTDTKGCTTTQTSVLTAPSPIVVNTTSTPSTGTNGTATATVSGGTPPYTYSWGSIPPQFTNAASNLPPGNFTIFVTDSKGCIETGTVTVQNSISIEDLSLGVAHFNVFPNPSFGTFMIEVKMTNSENIALNIQDMKGMSLYSSAHSTVSTLELPIEVSSFSKGVYIVSLLTEKGNLHIKLIIQ